MKRYKEQQPQKVADYLQEIEQIPKDKIACVDETGVDSYLHRECCWSPRGQKIIGQIAGKKHRRVGIVAARVGEEIIAPLQYDGTMNSLLFEAWFEISLMSELAGGSAIVMDNAAFHRKAKLAEIAQKHGHRVIFLPPYSPELNPIENFWAWLKAKLRKVLAEFPDFDAAIRYCFSLI